MTTYTVKAKRVTTYGKRVEDVEVNVNNLGDDVYITVSAEKSIRRYVMPTETWRVLAKETITPEEFNS